jgi:hypothetical protein
MVDLWVLLGFQGPLLLPPVTPPGPLAGALLVGLAIYNVMQLLQPPWSPNNSREKPQEDLPDVPGTQVSWRYNQGPGLTWTIRARGYSEYAYSGWDDWSPPRGFITDSGEEVGGTSFFPPGPNFSVVITSISTEEHPVPALYGTQIRLQLTVTSENGSSRVWLLSTGFGLAHEIEIFPKSFAPGQTNPGPGFPELPAAFIPSPYFEPQSDPERKPLAPPSPSPTPAPAPPAVPDKAEPTTPDGRPGSNPDGTPAAPPAPGTPPTPTPVPLGVPGPSPGGGSPSFPPAPVPGGVVRSTGQTGAPLANPAAVGAPGTSGAPQFRPTTADGQVQPQPAPGPSTTPAGQKTIAGTQVQPLRVPETIAGVAQELGRVESKLESLLRGADRIGNPTNTLENISNLLGLVQLIYDLLTEDVAAAEYEMTAPCDKDELGNPLVFQRSFPAEDYGPATLRRTEAILDALATLARWKQRTCAPMGGQPVNNVTITAYEVMEP